MPTADDYTAAASRFRATAEQLAREAGAQTAWDPSRFLGDGSVATTVADSLAEVRAALTAASDHLATLAVTCDRRAEVCAAYRREVWRYSQLPLLVRLVVSPPTRPARWADA